MKRVILLWAAAVPLAMGAGTLEVRAPGYDWTNAEYTTSHVEHQTYYRTVEIGGLDDCWVFINGQLVVDLGGVNHSESQYVPLDRLGLTDGEVYDIKIFMTERIKQREDVRIAMNFDFWEK